MYLTPGQLRKNFTVERRMTTVDTRGGQLVSWGTTGEIRGVLAEVRPDERLRWEQLQHPITHVIVAEGMPTASPGDRLVLAGRRFYVQGVDDPGGLGIWALYYCEERSDA